MVYTYGILEANISEIRINPKYNRFYPSYALFHELTVFYLQQQKYGYISDGYRNLMHKTSIQKLLIHKFGFKKVGLSLHLHFRQPYPILIKILLPFKHLIKKDSIAAVFNLVDIYQKQKRLPK